MPLNLALGEANACLCEFWISQGYMMRPYLIHPPPTENEGKCCLSAQGKVTLLFLRKHFCMFSDDEISSKFSFIKPFSKKKKKNQRAQVTVH